MKKIYSDENNNDCYPFTLFLNISIGKTEDRQYTNKEEQRVITGSEQETAKKLGEINEGEVTREDHRGQPYETTGPTSTQNVLEVIAKP